MTPAGFEPTVPARERQQTYALGHAVTRICPFAVYAPFSFLRVSIHYFILNLITAYFFKNFCHHFTSFSQFFFPYSL